MLTLAGLLFTLAGILHPQGHGDDFTTAVSSMLNSSQWPIAHWFALTSALLLVWAVLLLHDADLIGSSGIGDAGTRLTILGGVFMAVQLAVELAAHSEATALVAGQPHPFGGFIGLWIVWAGIQLTRGRGATEAASPTSTNLGRAKTGLEATARS